MNVPEIAGLRLATQQLAHPYAGGIPQLVRYMGAMQAQDFAMSKWAVGVRLPGVSDADVQTELDKGTILRTHVLRPTWHLIHAQDIRWMQELTSGQVKKLMSFTNKALGLTPDIYRKSTAVIESALAKRGHLTRRAIMEELKIKGLDISSIRPAHYMMEAELDGLVCSGRMEGKEQTYALVAERVPNPLVLSREESLVRLAKIFFTSHGPATAADFSWWSGLAAADVRIALNKACNQLESISIDGINYYFKANAESISIKNPVVHLLPAFDEFLISYKDRSACIALEHQSSTLTKNGIFKPTIMVNGQAVGTWKRSVKKDHVIMEAQYFSQPSDDIRKVISQTAQGFGKFLSKKIVFI